MGEFEEFFRGEPIRRGRSSAGQSGSSLASTGFQHKEDDEYLENLRLSGAFPEPQLAPKGRTSIKSTPTDLGISPVFRGEFEQQKDFENVFDLIEDSDEGTSVKLTAAQFRQYALPAQIRKLKEGKPAKPSGGAFLKKTNSRVSAKSGKEGPLARGKSPPASLPKNQATSKPEPTSQKKSTPRIGVTQA